MNAAATWLPAWAYERGLRVADRGLRSTEDRHAEVLVTGSRGPRFQVALDLGDGRRFFVYVKRTTVPVGLGNRVAESPWVATDSEPMARLALDLALGWALAKTAAPSPASVLAKTSAPIPVSAFDVGSLLADALWGLGTAEVHLADRRVVTLGDVTLIDDGLVERTRLTLTLDGQTFRVDVTRTF